MKLFAVFGKPVLHSKSPQIWNHAFACQGIPAHYFRINPLNADNAVRIIRELPLAGCNITTPFKGDMLECLDVIDESAELLGAVNTIRNNDGRLTGYNTDAYGVVNSLKEDLADPDGKKVVVLGAGGAARAAVYGLLRTNARDVVLLNRTYGKAVKAAERLGCRAAYFGRAQFEIQDADILISCVPSNRRIIRKHWLHEGLAVFDANYASDSVLLKDAQQAGCHVITGLNWLVHQAVPAFELFFEENPTNSMKEVLHSPVKKDTTSIAVIGFMATGKSIIGKYLAKFTGMEWVDTDELIEQMAGKSIPEIFQESGEEGFRDLERSVFNQLDLKSGKVISCGGGAIKDPTIRSLLKQHTLVVWLWSPLATSISRIQKGTRPLLDVENIEENAKKIFAERAHMYAKCADLMFVNETLEPQMIAQKIYGEIYRTDNN